MKNKQLQTILLLFFLTVEVVYSQSDSSELKLSVKEAQDYAITE